MAQRIRPQLASAPKQAALTRLEDATAFARTSAVFSSAAPFTVTVTNFVAPSPSRAIALARNTQTSSRARENASCSGFEATDTPDVPFAMIRIMSLVDVSPSTVTLLNDRFTARRRLASSSSREIETSVVRKQSMVAMFGCIIPEPFTMPPIRAPPSISTEISFLRVSVVMIASNAAAWPASSPRRLFASALMLFSMAAMGKGTPITPVEATITVLGLMANSSAASSAMRIAAAKPASPVQALAFPELAITAWIFLPAICFWLTSTLAAFTRFVVNMAAATQFFSE